MSSPAEQLGCALGVAGHGLAVPGFSRGRSRIRGTSRVGIGQDTVTTSSNRNRARRDRCWSRAGLPAAPRPGGNHFPSFGGGVTAELEEPAARSGIEHVGVKARLCEDSSTAFGMEGAIFRVRIMRLAGGGRVQIVTLKAIATAATPG